MNNIESMEHVPARISQQYFWSFTVISYSSVGDVGIKVFQGTLETYSVSGGI